ncbi:hypothetical protein I5935_22735 [Salmonella enterica subsp. enterica serovar Indiana]|nr:hypothetical protein [Salmonella enterica subsp. enterica serovar Indiana]
MITGVWKYRGKSNNYHGKHEFVTLEGMEKAVQVIVRIAELTAKRGQ